MEFLFAEWRIRENTHVAFAPGLGCAVPIGGVNGRVVVSEENLTDVVREKIVNKLIHAEYRPGHAFKLREMTESGEFEGISQTPIREALLQLVAQSILVGQRGFSIRVPTPTVESLAEVRGIRIRLEIMAATAGMAHWDEAGLAALAAVHRELMAAKRARAADDILRRNVQFHFALYAPAQMPYLTSMLRQLWAITGPSIRYLYETEEPVVPGGRHKHEDIIEALRRRDLALLEQAIHADGTVYGQKILDMVHAKLSPEALAVQPFKKIEGTRKRAHIGRLIKLQSRA